MESIRPLTSAACPKASSHPLPNPAPSRHVKLVAASLSSSLRRRSTLPLCISPCRREHPTPSLPADPLLSPHCPPHAPVRAHSSSPESQQPQDEKVPFGYTRKDVILIGVALTALGFGLRYGLEFAGLDGIQAGNVVQVVVVLGLCLGWVSTYLWRVGNKEMTYAQQLRDYEAKVMEKRLEALSEADLEAMLAEVEEEKERLRAKKAKLKE